MNALASFVVTGSRREEYLLSMSSSMVPPRVSLADVIMLHVTNV